MFSVRNALRVRHSVVLAALLLLPLFIMVSGREAAAALFLNTQQSNEANGRNQVSPTTCELVVHIQGDGRAVIAIGSKPELLADQQLNRRRMRCGSLVTLTAVPDGGWRFDHWEGVTEADRLRPAFQVSAPAEVTAVFVPRSTYFEPVATPFYDRSGELVSGIELLEPIAPALPGYDADAASTAAAAPVINVWYGNNQQFGQIGTPQEWINVLGNASDADGNLSSLRYTLNGGPALPVTFGGDGTAADGRRLWNLGDFNIDIDKDVLRAGDNQLVITAEDSSGQQTSANVTVSYDPATDWPIPFDINWSTVTSIQEVAQIVDGKWGHSALGVRPVETGYDRLIAIGEGNFAGDGWREFEVTVEITIHGYSEAGFQGSQVAPAVGLVARWQGHTDTPVAGCQPKCGWLPVGAVGWYTWDEVSRVPYYTMWAHHSRAEMKPAPSVPLMALNQTYNWKMRVENVTDTRGTYYFKVWQKGTSEPGWQASFDSSDRGWNYTMLESGSILLLAHHVDVTFGNVQIRPLAGGPAATATPTPAATATNPPVAPTATNTPVAPTATNTPLPTATNTPAATATNTTNPADCEPIPGNVLGNPGFEAGTSDWRLYTSAGVGSLDVTSPAYQCDFAARLTFGGLSSNMQFFQHGFPLQPNTDYVLTFAAYANSGHDLSVYLHRHSSPYTNYGINGAMADLSAAWQTFTIPFKTGSTVTNPRLRFWFTGNATSGDVYWIDDVRLVPTATNTPTATATNTPLPTVTNTPAPTATNTPLPTATNTPVPTATNTPVPTATNTPVAAATNTPTATATNTPLPTATNTPLPTATNTPLPTATNTPLPAATNTPLPTATNTPVPGGCAPVPGNVLSNPGFEDGTADWRLYTAGGVGSYITGSPAYECNLAAQLTFSGSSSNMQFFQYGFTLQPNTDYVLSFAAYSSSGHDLSLYMHRHSSPYTNYGLSGAVADLSTSWKTFTIPFKTGSAVTDPRLRFWFVGNASTGDVYRIDDVRITRAGG